jgi:hypothetical protein
MTITFKTSSSETEEYHDTLGTYRSMLRSMFVLGNVRLWTKGHGVRLFCIRNNRLILFTIIWPFCTMCIRIRETVKSIGQKKSGWSIGSSDEIDLCCMILRCLQAPQYTYRVSEISAQVVRIWWATKHTQRQQRNLVTLIQSYTQGKCCTLFLYCVFRQMIGVFYGQTLDKILDQVRHTKCSRYLRIFSTEIISFITLTTGIKSRNQLM